MSKVELKKRVVLRELLQKNEAIWVVNNTGNPGVSKEPGVIVFQVGSGDTVGSVTVPPGDDPVCISDQVDGASLNSCRDLFKLINKGTLTLLDPTQAEAYYEQNEARLAIIQEKVTKQQNKQIDPDAPKPKLSKGDVNVVEIRPKVVDICLHAKHEAISEKIALENLIEQSKSLREEDFVYISKNGHFPKVKEWAKDRLGGRHDDPTES